MIWCLFLCSHWRCLLRLGESNPEVKVALNGGYFVDISLLETMSDTTKEITWMQEGRRLFMHRQATYLGMLHRIPKFQTLICTVCIELLPKNNSGYIANKAMHRCLKPDLLPKIFTGQCSRTWSMVIISMLKVYTRQNASWSQRSLLWAGL